MAAPDPLSPYSTDTTDGSTSAASAPLLPRALPLLLSDRPPSVDLVSSWHRSVLPSHSPSAVRRDVFFLSAVAVFVSLLFLFHRCAARRRRNSRFGRLWSEWSALQRVEWLSYAVSTAHAIIASVAGFVSVAHSLHRLHTQSQSHSQSDSGGEGLWPAVTWFARTSLHPLLAFLSASQSFSSSSPSSSSLSSSSPPSPSSVSAESSFSLALSCVFGESSVRDCSLLLTAAYLLVDLVLCLASTAIKQQKPAGRRVQLASPLTLLHHALILLAFGWGVASQTGTLYMCGLLLNELSTPSLNANYFLSASSLSSSHPRVYVCNGVLLLALFVSARVLWNGVLVCHIFMFSWSQLQPLWRSDSRWLMSSGVRWRCAALSALCCGHVCINAVWAVQLGRAVHRKWSRAAVNHTVTDSSSSTSSSKHKNL